MAISEQIIQVIDALCEKLGLAVDWTSANVIPYLTTMCERLIAYEIWTSVFYIGMMTTLAIAGVLATKRLLPVFKKGLEEQGYGDVGWSIASFFAIAGLVALYVVAFCVIAVQVEDIIKCVTFPEMYVFEYVQSLINSGS